MHSSPLSSRTFERILLIKPSAVGDVIHTVPVLAKLRARYPAARIDWLLTPAIAELVGRHPALSNVVPFDRTAYARAWRSWSAATTLGRMVADDPPGALRSGHRPSRAIPLRLVGMGQRRAGADRLRPPAPAAAEGSDRRLNEQAYRHGWTGAREGAWLAYTHRIPIPTLDVHAVDRYLWLAPMLGLDDGPPDFRLPVSPEAEVRADALIERHGLAGRPLAVLVPGTLWETKHWHVEGFAEVAPAADADGPGGGAGGVGGGAAALPGGGRALPWRARSVRPDDAVRPGGPDPAGGGVRHQRLRLDAP